VLYQTNVNIIHVGGVLHIDISPPQIYTGHFQSRLATVTSSSLHYNDSLDTWTWPPPSLSLLYFRKKNQVVVRREKKNKIKCGQWSQREARYPYKLVGRNKNSNWLKLIYDPQSVGQSVLVSGPIWDLWLIFLSLEIPFRRLRVCYFVAPSLTRGRVCNLLYNCFWAVTLGSSPAELTTIFYCLIWDSPNLEGQVPVFISPRYRVVQLYPRALG
jgi:hypothetical protein